MGWMGLQLTATTTHFGRSVGRATRIISRLSPGYRWSEKNVLIFWPCININLHSVLVYVSLCSFPKSLFHLPVECTCLQYGKRRMLLAKHTIVYELYVTKLYFLFISIKLLIYFYSIIYLHTCIWKRVPKGKRFIRKR